MIQAVTATITTAADGTATVYVGSRLRGRVHAIFFDIDTLTDTIDLTITGETTGVPILVDSPAADEWFYPRALVTVHTTGAVSAIAVADIHVVNERIKVVAAQGGDTKTGTITVYVDTPDPY